MWNFFTYVRIADLTDLLRTARLAAWRARFLEDGMMGMCGTLSPPLTTENCS
jgi:hypothetical protein